MALITAAEARDYIRGLSGTAEDTLLDTLIARAGAEIAAYLGYPAEGGAATLEDVTYTHYLEGDGGPAIRLPAFPVVSITTLHDSPARTYGAADLVDSGDYDLLSDFGLIVLKTNGTKTAFSSSYRAIKVVYSAGYATVPTDIKGACGLQVAHLYNHRDSIGTSSISKGGGSASVKRLDLLPEVRGMLQSYRLAGGWLA